MLLIILLFTFLFFLRLAYASSLATFYTARWEQRQRISEEVASASENIGSFSHCPSRSVAWKLALRGLQPASNPNRTGSSPTALILLAFLGLASCGNPEVPSSKVPEFLYHYETWADVDGSYASESCGNFSLTEKTLTYLTEGHENIIDRITDPIRNDQLKEFSGKIHKVIVNEFPLVKNADSKRVETVFESLKQFAPRSVRPSLEVYLVKSGQVVNAFTIAGGNIYITTSMLRSIQNEDELALVLGHEIAHQVKGHTTLKLRQQKFLVENLGEVGGKITDAIINLVTIPFNIPEEYEADCGGMWLCAQAGYNVEKGIMIFSRWANQEKSAPKNSFVSTHPKASKRFACCATLTAEAKQRAIEFNIESKK